MHIWYITCVKVYHPVNMVLSSPTAQLLQNCPLIRPTIDISGLVNVCHVLADINIHIYLSRRHIFKNAIFFIKVFTLLITSLRFLLHNVVVCRICYRDESIIELKCRSVWWSDWQNNQTIQNNYHYDVCDVTLSVYPLEKYARQRWESNLRPLEYYTLRVTSQTSYSPEYTTPTQKKISLCC
jgi:hypothetical protein